MVHVHTARLKTNLFIRLRAQTREMETTLTAIATDRRAWPLYHSYCSLEHGVTLGACAECQPLPHKLGPLSQLF